MSPIISMYDGNPGWITRGTVTYNLSRAAPSVMPMDYISRLSDSNHLQIVQAM